MALSLAAAAALLLTRRRRAAALLLPPYQHQQRTEAAAAVAAGPPGARPPPRVAAAPRAPVPGAGARPRHAAPPRLHPHRGRLLRRGRRGGHEGARSGLRQPPPECHGRLPPLRPRRSLRALRRVLAPGAPFLRRAPSLRALHPVLPPRQGAGGRRAGDRIRGGARAGAPVDLSGLLSGYANAVVCRAAFGDESARALFGGGEGDRGRERIRKVLTDFQQLLGTEPVGELLPWLGWVDAVRGLQGKNRRTFEALDGLLEKVIDDHRHRSRNGDDGDHRDFVDVVLDVNCDPNSYEAPKLGSETEARHREAYTD